MNDLKITTPIEREGQRVLTTAQLAEAYGTTIDTINRNFNRNKLRYIEGKHFYRLTGNELKEFKKTTGQIDRQFKQAPSLYLWTEKGALLHAKSLSL
ncbi:MAG: ORF6N domain-containing protein [Prevotella sp.]|nr:ORF6N domain-containing protein [Alistipes senegalensis]MCM1357951.1 ORF6N domain-containing protein [Prevotella sp.]MCM1472932.1 ORF6N domain-containing protein [Muribaculaceae bacterium]